MSRNVDKKIKEKQPESVKHYNLAVNINAKLKALMKDRYLINKDINELQREGNEIEAIVTKNINKATDPNRPGKKLFSNADLRNAEFITRVKNNPRHLEIMQELALKREDIQLIDVDIEFYRQQLRIEIMYLAVLAGNISSLKVG